MQSADTTDPNGKINALNVLPPQVRMPMLEDCLDAGLKYSSRLAELIERAAQELGDDGDIDADSEAFGREKLDQWIKEADEDEIKEEHRQLEILVGVQGKTGAGKTSLLNALLGFKDLLPPNDALVATAAICQVAYNYCDDPKKAFRAEITFRKHLDVKHELNRFFEDVKLRNELLNGRGEFEDDDDKDSPDSSDLGEIIERINATAEKIGPVWGHNLTELEGMSTQDLLKKDDPAVKLLSTTKRINSPDLATFAPAIKPYLDATTTSISGRAGRETRDMAVWPLIDHVKVYVKSDILRGGIVLVDLPGLGEIVESRAAVAKNFYNRLTVTIVVTPSVRAAGEKTAVDLMTENQEINMRMSGKLDDRGYCIVLSKADDGIDWETTARNQHRQNDIKMMAELDEKITEETAAVRNIMPKLQELYGTLQVNKKISKAEQRTLRAELRDMRNKERSHLKVRSDLQRQKKEFHWGQIFAAVQSRSALLKKDINNYLKGKHAVFMKNCPGVHAPYCPPKIFPISVRAYWPLRKRIGNNPYAPQEDPLYGFPDEAYTGIPALKSWLYEATIPPRERHMKALLHRLVGLYNSLRTWSDQECEKIKLHMTPEEVQEKYLNTEFKLLEKKLKAFGVDLSDKVAGCNPLKNTNQALGICVEKCIEQVKNWIYKDPQGANPHAKLAYATFFAIIKAGGGCFLSRAKGQRLIYDWMDGLANTFRNQIVSQWVSLLHKQLPSLEVPARAGIDDRWDYRVNKIIGILSRTFPRQRKYLATKTSVLKSIKEEVKDLVVKALDDVAVNSDGLHKELAADLKGKWKPTFKKAAGPKLKGKGSMKNRHQVLVKFAETKADKTYKDAVMKMKKEVSDEINKFPMRLEAIWITGSRKLREQVDLIMDNIVEYEKEQGDDDSMGGLESEEGEVGSSEESRKQKIVLQESIRAMLYEWFSSWDGCTDDIPMIDADDSDQKQGTRASWLKQSEIPKSFSLGSLGHVENEAEENCDGELIDRYLDGHAEEDKLLVKEEDVDSD
ncbi:hypothetical protein NCU05557 [Neurospora crassa OR74A]|uniref:Dynamin N-terminal domain-containing protein n=1 Tax=Neurospora crassa (strain ATCC 24698 / 74-OR23-1A / CBS 708.71 / DSM 1257 / FGSC 987) TaxID=367110 RepID=Q7S706_NEUCR|nr:hypothetical protein NCU05557 [Neurospora crassa OR74A]EAA31283.1 hypothetical protein NCU05557 [Neurospora crassa OR74A]|eukprot:XP_960519.1 hypothetical protein NCU05557 [Neurospora crassa OR74A]